jgi:zinc transport system ATP-binding protein
MNTPSHTLQQPDRSIAPELQAHAVVIENVSFAYDREPVLKNVDLQIETGNFTVLIGPNGGGKTTLLKLILGLLEPDRGSVRVFGRAPHAVAHRIGYVPQYMHVNTGFPISALDVVLMGRLGPGRKRSSSGHSDLASARQALDRLDMGRYHSHRIGDLSGGQVQRVMIARALVSQPELLLLDEPTANIDPKGQKNFYDLLIELNQSLTILLVSHDAMMLSSYAKSVACVNQTVFYHDEAEITDEMINMHQCPVELVAHGLPHRVLKKH